MLKRASGLVPLAAFVLACTGCERISFNYYDRRPARVHRRLAHVCTYDCHHHYYDGTRLVVLTGHHHGPGCGHHWDGSRYVIVRKGRVRYGHPQKSVVVKHVHGPSCGHVYSRRGSKWLAVRKGHVHGHGCGHVHANGRWSVHIR